MNFNLNRSLELLERSPGIYKALLSGLSKEWILINEGPETWSAFDIVGHLIHGEKTDWIPRARIILSTNEHKVFEPFNRFAQEENSKGKTMEKLLDEFSALRNANLQELRSWNLSEEDLDKEGTHPDLGTVNLRQLISTWTVHDVNHLHQVSRVMAKYYKEDVGPWSKYLKILNVD